MMLKKLLSVFLACLLTLSPVLAFPASAGRADGVEGPAVYLEDFTLAAGKSKSTYLYCQNFEALGAAELSLYYDASVFTISGSKVQSIANGASTSFDESTPGQAHMLFAKADGISGSGALWGMTIKVNATAPVGSHRIRVVAGDVYDTALNPVNMTTVDCIVTVTEAATTVKSITFTGNSDSTAYEKGQNFTVKFSTSNFNGFAAGDFEIYYDRDDLTLDKVTLGKALTNANGATYYINSDTAGYVKISYVCLAQITSSASPAISLNFTVKANRTGTTELQFHPSALTDAAFTSISANSVTLTRALVETVEAPVLPSIFIENYAGSEKEFSLDIKSQGDTRLAAGDFVLSFDPALISVSAIQPADGCILVPNINNEKGQIRFSFICQDGLPENATLGTIFVTKNPCFGGEMTWVMSGKGLADEAFAPVEILFPEATLTIPDTHTFSVKNRDETNHWMQCVRCGTVDESTREAHGFDNACDTTCNECGYVREITHSFTKQEKNSTEHWTKCSICGTVDETSREAHVYDNSTDTVCNVCGYTCPALAFYGANLTLENDLTVNFAVQKSLIDSSGIENPYVVFVLGDRTVKVTEYRSEQGYYVFPFKNIAPQMLGDSFNATLYATYKGREYSSATATYSITKYCDRVFADANAAPKLKTLIADLILYGTAAQQYTGHKTGALVKDQFAEAVAAYATKTVPAAESVSNAKYKEIASPSVQWTGASLNLYESVSIQLQFAAANTKGLTAEVRDEKGTLLATLTEEEITKSGSTYTLFYKGLNAGEMRKPVFITFFDANGNAVSNTLRYSVESYVAIVHQYGGDAKLVALLDAMLNYGISAEIYAK